VIATHAANLAIAAALQRAYQLGWYAGAWRGEGWSPGRRRAGDVCPDFWFYLKTQDRTFGDGNRRVYVVYACSDKCRSELWEQWKRGPGPGVIDESGSQRDRDKRRAKESGGG
jgi:hypothetical protein